MNDTYWWACRTNFTDFGIRLHCTSSSVCQCFFNKLRVRALLTVVLGAVCDVKDGAQDGEVDALAVRRRAGAVVACQLLARQHRLVQRHNMAAGQYSGCDSRGCRAAEHVQLQAWSRR